MINNFTLSFIWFIIFFDQISFIGFNLCSNFLLFYEFLKLISRIFKSLFLYFVRLNNDTISQPSWIIPLSINFARTKRCLLQNTFNVLLGCHQTQLLQIFDSILILNYFYKFVVELTTLWNTMTVESNGDNYVLFFIGAFFFETHQVMKFSLVHKGLELVWSACHLF